MPDYTLALISLLIIVLFTDMKKALNAQIGKLNTILFQYSLLLPRNFIKVGLFVYFNGVICVFKISMPVFKR